MLGTLPLQLLGDQRNLNHADLLLAPPWNSVITVLCSVYLCVLSAIGVSGSSHWELMGDALVTTDQVRLTPDMQSKQGAVWSRMVSAGHVTDPYTGVSHLIFKGPLHTGWN